LRGNYTLRRELVRLAANAIEATMLTVHYPKVAAIDLSVGAAFKAGHADSDDG